MQTEANSCPNLNDYFEKVSLRHALVTRHPYDFIDTYLVLRDFFGYRTHYVNFGFWGDGFNTVEPGRQLAIELGEELCLCKGDRLIDVGSGLGQASVDLCRNYDLERVAGLNPNTRQVAFANALAQYNGLNSKIYHVVGDASSDLKQFSGQGFNSIIAMECVGHFRNPEVFLETTHKVLTSDGRIVLSLNGITSKCSLLQRGLFYAAFGFTPTSIETWVERLERAGFCHVRVRNLTDRVLIPGLTFALKGARHGSTKIHPAITFYIKTQLKTALRSVSNGVLQYYAVSASVGPKTHLTG